MFVRYAFQGTIPALAKRELRCCTSCAIVTALEYRRIPTPVLPCFNLITRVSSPYYDLNSLPPAAL